MKPAHLGSILAVIALSLFTESCESPQSTTLRTHIPEIQRVLTTGQIGTYAYESKHTSPNCIRATYDSLVKLAQAPDAFTSAIMLLSMEEIETIAEEDPVSFYDKFLNKKEDDPQRFTILNTFVEGDFLFVNCTENRETSDPLPIRMRTLAFEVVDGRLFYYNPWALDLSIALAPTLE